MFEGVQSIFKKSHGHVIESEIRGGLMSEHVASARFDWDWASHGEASTWQSCTLSSLLLSSQHPSKVTFSILASISDL